MNGSWILAFVVIPVAALGMAWGITLSNEGSARHRS